MSIVELGALGEFAGALAVLVTLLYLAVQLKATRNAMEDQSIQAATQSTASLSMALLSADPMSPHAVAKGSAGGTLDDHEETLYGYSLNVGVWQFAAVFESPSSKHRNRLLANYRNTIDYWWANPNFRKAWDDSLRARATPQFVEYFESFRPDS